LDDNIKMNPKETQCLDMDGTELSQNETCVKGNKTATLLQDAVSTCQLAFRICGSKEDIQPIVIRFNRIIYG
jgi:hypothetical protein